MNRKNWVPLNAVSRCASLLFVCSLSFTFLAATAAESLAQSSAGRPAARLITASRPQPARPQEMQHRVYARPASAIASAPVAASSFERQAFDLINAARVKNRLPPLAWDGDLCRAARAHSENMGRRNFFDHEGPDGTSLLDRVNAIGIAWRSLGENIAYNKGQVDPVRVAVEQWMQSPKHLSNIMRAKYTHTAIGVARTADGRVYVTQIFMMR
ncbi:MAG TPA: CAP domain-containing protein [Pyrinomonadaceae bacterium]|nr:CAP domain-containing protein [Pyrinomonadaceae bacterium]